MPCTLHVRPTSTTESCMCTLGQARTEWVRAQAKNCLEPLSIQLLHAHFMTGVISACNAARQDGTDIAVPYIMQRQDDGSEVPVFLRHTTTSTAGNGTRRWRRGATSYRHLLWPNATVVYSIGTEYTGTRIALRKQHLRRDPGRASLNLNICIPSFY